MAFSHHDDGALDDLVLQRGDRQRSLPPVRLRYVRPARRKRPIAASMDPIVQSREPWLEFRLVVRPGHPVHAGGGLALSLHPDKTRVIEFGRFAAANREQRGQGKPETFKFLGFTFICGKSEGRTSGLVMRETGCSAGGLDHVTAKRPIPEPMRPISVHRWSPVGAANEGQPQFAASRMGVGPQGNHGSEKRCRRAIDEHLTWARAQQPVRHHAHRYHA